MGAGKTSVGRIVAAQLRREFIDVDALIETREQKTVREIFETHGEEYFRACERAACVELAARAHLVIATGGGVWGDPRNRAAFADAWVVCLDASVETILARLAGARDRPLLANGDRRQRIETLLQERRAAYAQIETHIQTDGLSIADAAEEIVALFARATRAQIRPRLRVPTPENDYGIFLGRGGLARVGEIARGLDSNFSRRCAIITNPTVGAIYAARVAASLAQADFDPEIIEIPDGEEFKTLDTARAVYDRLIDARLDRRSPIFALGGGVVGDLAGYVAATFLRGVPFVPIPTTLLAMVDASIGGKSGVNHPRGKNLIGAFKQPRAVIADLDALATLPAAELREGMAEVVKHAIIGDAELFRALEAGEWKMEVGDWMERALRVKVAIVARDPFEAGERAQLNLGHTFAHAFETAAHYQMRHGNAVALGLVCAARLAARRGLCDRDLAARVENLVRALGLPTRAPAEFTAGEILAAMQTDKKRVGSRLRFILPRALGDVVGVDDVSESEVKAALAEIGAEA